MLIFLAQFSIAQTDIPDHNDSTETIEVTVIEEILPSWLGCESEISEEARSQCTYKKIQEFLSENLKYPTEAKKKNVTGTVYLTFVLNKFGKVEDVRVLQSVSPELDEEALRLISLMPNWNPGIQRGKAVNVQYNLPVKFTLRKGKK